MSRIAYDPCYAHPIPSNHRFPMQKYKLLYEQVILEKLITPNELIRPELMDPNELRVHDEVYVHRLVNLQLDKQEEKATGFVHDRSLIDRELKIVDGTIKCARNALSNGFTFNIAGGTHHAFANKGEGFCFLNDQAEAAKLLIDEELVERVLIVDLDVHQGNGTANIFKDESRIFTFSMHGKSNYPLKKENSDLDIELNDQTKDYEYLILLEKALENIMSLFRPDFIFYQCGADVLATDKLGRLSLTMKGCYERDVLVFQAADKLGIPITACSGGGYSEEIAKIVEVHYQTIKNGLVLKKTGDIHL